MTTYKDTGIEAPIVFNKLTQTQLSNATDLDPTQQYLVDPEFTGNKLLKTTEEGDIVETDETINDASLIIQKNGEDIQTFSANASSNTVANIPVPVYVTDLSDYGNYATNPRVINLIDGASITVENNTIYKAGEISVVLPLKNGKVLVCSETDLCLFDLTTKQKLTSIDIPTGIWSIKELYNGDVAVGQGNGDISILEIGNEIKIKLVLKGHKKTINFIIELDNHKLVTAGDEINMILWNLKDPEAKYFIEGHSENVTALANLGSNKFISASKDKTIKVWE